MGEEKILENADLIHRVLSRGGPRSFFRAPFLSFVAAPALAMIVVLPYFLVSFFLVATVARRGPLRVRAFVFVRWPRTGSPRRCRTPR